MDGPSCPGRSQRDALIASLSERLAALEAEVRDLRARLGQNASNSSPPPSANPPDGPKPVVKKGTGRRPGGQPGHAPYTRVRLPADRVRHVLHYLPAACRGCGHALPQEPGLADPPPTWHRVAELPDLAAIITEHRGHARTCPGCGVIARQPIPAAIRAHAIGPRLAAVMAYLSGARHDSKRGVEEVVEAVFGGPVGLGTVAAVGQEVSAALAPAHTEVGRAVRQAPAKHADETGWTQAGQPRWLWAAVTQTAAYFVVHARRGLDGLHALLGETVTGVVVSDRWSAYGRRDVYRRQLCWAHLKRDFQGLVDRGGPGRAVGAERVCFTEDVFYWWYRGRDGALSRATLRTYLDCQRPWLRDLPERGTECGGAKTAALCRSLLAWEPALWAFVRHPGVEPTNGAAERALRPAVLWRKRSRGSRSDAGCRFAERMLTVVPTLRLQKRQVLSDLADAVTAHRTGRPAPDLMPAG